MLHDYVIHIIGGQFGEIDIGLIHLQVRKVLVGFNDRPYGRFVVIQMRNQFAVLELVGSGIIIQYNHIVFHHLNHGMRNGCPLAIIEAAIRAPLGIYIVCGIDCRGGIRLVGCITVVLLVAGRKSHRHSSKKSCCKKQIFLHFCIYL